MPRPKIGVQQLKIVRKPNFLPNFMGFKVGFHGFYGFSAHKMYIKYNCGLFAFILCPKPCVWVKTVVPETSNCDKTQFLAQYHRFKGGFLWVFMGFMGFMRTNSV